MGPFLLKRLATLLITLAVASAVVFAVLELLPGNAAEVILGDTATPESLAALQAKLGLDRPPLTRYADWVAGLLRGDTSRSISYDTPTAELIAERLQVTLPLAVMAMGLTMVLALGPVSYTHLDVYKRQTGMAQRSVYDFEALSITGKPAHLGTQRGKVLLIVNTASACGFTPQFKGLEKLWEDYRDRGLVIVGFPSNEFGGQDPGSNDQIASFCEINYGVSFPMMSKVQVNGAQAHPLWMWLKSQAPGLLGSEGIKWNFTKFLVCLLYTSGITMGTGLAFRRTFICSWTLKKLAPVRSILFTKARRGTLYLLACRQTVSDWGCTPPTAQ